MLISSTNIRLRTIVCSSDVMEVKKIEAVLHSNDYDALIPNTCL